MFWLKACPRCQGDLHDVQDVGDQYVTCLQCGRILTEEQEKALPRLPAPAKIRRIPFARPELVA
jgi:hypothetical protein